MTEIINVSMNVLAALSAAMLVLSLINPRWAFVLPRFSRTRVLAALLCSGLMFAFISIRVAGVEHDNITIFVNTIMLIVAVALIMLYDSIKDKKAQNS